MTSTPTPAADGVFPIRVMSRVPACLRRRWRCAVKSWEGIDTACFVGHMIRIPQNLVETERKNHEVHPVPTQGESIGIPHIVDGLYLSPHEKNVRNDIAMVRPVGIGDGRHQRLSIEGQCRHGVATVTVITTRSG